MLGEPGQLMKQRVEAEILVGGVLPGALEGPDRFQSPSDGAQDGS